MSHTLKFNPSSDMLKAEKLGYTKADAEAEHYVHVTYDFAPLWAQVTSDEETERLEGIVALEALCKRGLDIACSPYDIYSKMEAKVYDKFFKELPKGEHPVSQKISAKMAEWDIPVSSGSAKACMRAAFQAVTGFVIPERAPAASNAEKSLRAVRDGKFTPAELEVLARAIKEQQSA